MGTTKRVRRQSGLHHPVSVYAKQVVQGKLRDQCCKWEILACQRHLDDLKRQGTPDFPYVFDTTRADRIFRFFGQCIQSRGVEAGKPVTLQPWQPKFSRYDFKVEDYGLIVPISNDLLRDNDAGLLQYLARWLTKKWVLTENLAILEILAAIESSTTLEAGQEIVGLNNG